MNGCINGMIISGYVYKFGNEIGSSGTVACTESMKNAVTRFGREYNHVPCLLGYSRDVHDRAVIGGYNMSDVLGYATLKVCDDGIYAFVKVIETPVGRTILNMSDYEIMEQFKFGFALYGERIDTDANGSTLVGNITIGYITLAKDNIHYKIDKIER